MRTYSSESLLRALNTTSKPLLMGIINRTPDSFSDGGKHFDSTDTEFSKAIEQAQQMVANGAQILDVGGESSRPGSKAVGLREEMARVIPFIRALAKLDVAWLSIDTRHASVAAAAYEAGAHFVNDISAGGDPRMFPFLAQNQLPCCLMHMQGNPETMQSNPQYSQVHRDVRDFLRERSLALQNLGLSTDHILLDPGIGFGKTLEHNLCLLENLESLPTAQEGLLLGASRKSFILNFDQAEAHLEPSPSERLGGSLAALGTAILAGVKIVRVHDVQASSQFLRLFHRLNHP